MKFTVNTINSDILRKDLKPLTLFKYKTPFGLNRVEVALDNGSPLDFNPATGHCGEVYGDWLYEPVTILGTLKFEN